MLHEVTIPHHFIWMANGNTKLFYRYIDGYLKHSYPGYVRVKIQKDIVFCERREIFETRKKPKQKSKNSNL